MIVGRGLEHAQRLALANHVPNFFDVGDDVGMGLDHALGQAG